MDGIAAVVGGHPQIWPVPGVSGDAGDGGGGVSPFKEFSDYDVAQTDTTSGPTFYHSDADNAIVVLGPAADRVFHHDLANFTAAATQYTVNGNPVRTAGQSGCLNYEGTTVWLSGDTAGSYPIRSIDVAAGTMLYYDTADAIVIGAIDAYIIVYSGGQVLSYNAANGVSHTLGSIINTWAIDINNSISMALIWSTDGWGWTFREDNLYRFKGGTTAYYVESTPTTNGAVFHVQAPITYDSNRNCFYASMSDQAADPDEATGIFRISGWAATVSDFAQWTRVTSGVAMQAIHYDPTTDIIFALDSTNFKVYRYMASTGQLIDIVSVHDDTAPDNPQVDYDLDADRHIFYEGIYGYVTGEKGGLTYLIRIEYSGAPIDGSGLGASITTGPLIAHFSVIDAQTVDIKIIRAGQPNVFADAQGSVHIDFTPA